MLYRLGLRQLGLSWAFDTEIGAPQSDRSGRGLTDFGRDVVRELNNLGMVVDATHLARRSIEDVLETSKSPITVSHSGAAALNPTLNPEGGWSQLLPDDLLKEVAAAGGVISVHFMSHIVKGGPGAELHHLMAQFRYLTDLIGPNHVACGPDYLPLNPQLWENQGAEPFSYVRGVETVADFRNVTRMLVAGGMSDDDIRWILGQSLLSLFRTVRQFRSPNQRQYVFAAEGFGACTEGITPL